MALYQVCDLVLASETPLPELRVGEVGRPNFAFKLVLSPTLEYGPVEWFHRWSLPDEETWMSFGRVGRDYLLRFTDLADYVIRIEEREIYCYPNPDTPLETIRHLLLDQVIPLVLSSQGKLVLHASAVATPEGAIAFIGSTGRGKSTLAASFTKRGFPLLTDDCLWWKTGTGASLPSQAIRDCGYGRRPFPPCSRASPILMKSLTIRRRNAWAAVKIDCRFAITRSPSRELSCSPPSKRWTPPTL